MITISILGLDPFVVGKYSKENTANLANLYEVDSSKILFSAPSVMVFHEGAEQTSWNAIVIVRAPLKVKVLESQIADYLLKTLTTYTVHVQITFQYYEQDRFYEYVNPGYPRFIEDNDSEEDYNEEESECECGCDHDHEDHCEDEQCDCHKEESVYLGNAFEGFEEKLAEAQKNKK